MDSSCLAGTRQLALTGASQCFHLLLGDNWFRRRSAFARQAGPGKRRLGGSLVQCKQCFLFFVFIIFPWDCKLRKRHKWAYVILCNTQRISTFFFAKWLFQEAEVSTNRVACGTLYFSLGVGRKENVTWLTLR